MACDCRGRPGVLIGMTHAASASASRSLLGSLGALALIAVTAGGCAAKDEAAPDMPPTDPGSGRPDDHPLPSAKALRLAVGDYVSCVVVEGGAVRCWGQELDAPVVGYGKTVTAALIPLQVAGLTSGATDVFVGSNNACAVVAGGKLKCWGTDRNGELGANVMYTDNRPKESATPVDVVGLSGVKQVAIADDHLCAMTTQGAVSCWGTNENGELGNQSVTGASSVPVPVPGLSSGVVAVAAGYHRSFAVTSAGALKVWGGDYGPVPVDVAVLGVASGVTSGSWGAFNYLSGSIWSMCVVTSAGEVKCFGTNNKENQLGNGTDHVTSPDKALPVGGITSGATSVSMGSVSACAIVSGAARCWGSNQNGQLGNGGDVTLETFVSVPLPGLTGRVVTLQVGYGHACALLDSGAVKCWGEGGARGDHSTTSDVRITAPVDVVSLP